VRGQIHPATAVLLVHGVAPIEVARRAEYAPGTMYAQLQGRLRLTRRTFDAIAELGSVDVGLEVCAALGVDHLALPPGWPLKANDPPESGSLLSENTDATHTAKRGGTS
jgi:hypothetical protein